MNAQNHLAVNFMQFFVKKEKGRAEICLAVNLPLILLRVARFISFLSKTKTEVLVV